VLFLTKKQKKLCTAIEKYAYFMPVARESDDGTSHVKSNAYRYPGGIGP
jgi:hypothetical protein